MTIINFDVTTPQSKFVKSVFDAALTRDFTNIRPFVSKDYTYQTFPKIAGLPDEDKEGHFQRYGSMSSLVTKLEANFDEVIEAPGKVVVRFAIIFHTIDGNKFDYDSLCIFTLVEENGELKIANTKDFSDPEKRGNFHDWAAKALARGVA